MKRVLRLVIAVCMLVGAIAIVDLNRPIQAQSAAEQAKLTAAEALVAKAQSSRGAYVIVRLPLGGLYTPEPGLSAPQVANQRSAIASARAALIADIAAFGGSVYRSWDTLPYVALKVGMPALQRLAASPLALSIQEDELSSPMLASSTALIGADITAASGFRGDNWSVVILDTGIDTNHPFYTGRVVWQACFSGGSGGDSLCPGGGSTQVGPGAAEVTINPGGGPIPNCSDGGSQLCSHGSHVAGIAAGEDPGTQGYNGVAPGANIIAIQVFSRFNDDGDCDGDAPCVKSATSDQLSALNYVHTDLVVPGPWDIASVNMSLGGSQSAGACDGDSRKAPIDTLVGDGVATVIAAGNDGWTDTVSVPGCISTAVTVGGVNDSDQLSFNNGAPVDILAPGISIDSSIPNDTYANFQGTSMATPHVTGAFAVMRSILGSGPSVNDILTILQNAGPLVTDMRAFNNPGGGGTGGGYVKPRLQLDVAVADVLDADLRVLKDCQPDTPTAAGQTATCTIFVDNLGPGPAINVELVDELLSSGTFTIGTVTTDVGTCTKTSNPQVGAGTVTCDLNNMAVGARATIVIPISATTPQTISDVASASGDTGDPDHTNDVASDVLSFEATADLSITKTDTPDPVTAGETLNYHITVTNNGPSSAPNVIVKDVLPGQVDFVSAFPSVGSCAGTTVPGDPLQPLTCNLGLMANGQVRTIDVMVKVKPDTADGMIIVNNASVQSDANDPANGNNVATSPATVQTRADLRIIKTDSPDPVFAGGTLTYSLAVTNLGPSTARTVIVNDTLPAGVSFVSVAVGGGGGSCSPIAPNLVQCTLGDLDLNANRIITIQAKVASDVPNNTVLNNTAGVASQTTDPVPANNQSTAMTTVLTRADLWLDKTAELLTGNPSRTIRFTLNVYNKPGCEADDALSCGTGGPSDAQNVVVTDPLPFDPKKLKVVFVSQNCAYNQGTHTVTCTVAGPLPYGQFASFIIDVQSAGNLGTLSNTASLTSSTTDPTASNNSDVVQLIIKGGSARP